MLPLAPPVRHWEKLHKFVSRYVWKGKRPRVKMSILQQHKLSGGLSWVSKFPILFLVLNTPTSTYLVKSVGTGISLVKPRRLQDFIYSNIPIKTCTSKFGSLILHLVATWRTVESHSILTFLYLIIFPFAWVVTWFCSLNGVIGGSIPFRTSHQKILSDLFKTWNLISTYRALLFSPTYNSAVPYGHTEFPGGETGNLIQSIKYVEIFRLGVRPLHLPF